MAHFYRLIFRVLVLVLIAASGGVHASFPATPAGTKWTTSNLVSNGFNLVESSVFTGDITGPESQAACGAMGSATAPGYGTRYFYYSPGGGSCVLQGVGLLATASVSQSCPANATLSGSQCTCNDGYKEQGGACVVQLDSVSEFCAALPGAQYSNQEVVTGSSAPPSGGCTPTMYVDQTTRGCGGTFQREFSAQYDGKWYHYGTLTLTGGTCNLVEGATGENPDGTTPTDAAPPADDRKCPNGFPGTVNGIETCVPYSGQNGVGVSGGTTTTTNPDGSTTTTTTQGQTSCTGASCTTTTTTTTTTGGGTPSTTTTSTTTTRNEFCRKNATDPVCTGSATGGGGGGDGNGDEEASSFGGSCGAWTCDGDAIQCAIAREQHQRNCKLFDDPPDSVYAAAADGSDGINADKLKSEAQQVSVGSFDSAGFGWGSSCPADPSIPLNFGGRSAEFSIPFSRICGPLGILSMAGVGITLLGSMVWVLGGRNNRG